MVAEKKVEGSTVEAVLFYFYQTGLGLESTILKKIYSIVQNLPAAWMKRRFCRSANGPEGKKMGAEKDKSLSHSMRGRTVFHFFRQT
jgi:hypothetical protein